MSREGCPTRGTNLTYKIEAEDTMLFWESDIPRQCLRCLKAGVARSKGSNVVEKFSQDQEWRKAIETK